MPRYRQIINKIINKRSDIVIQPAGIVKNLGETMELTNAYHTGTSEKSHEYAKSNIYLILRIYPPEGIQIAKPSEIHLNDLVLQIPKGILSDSRENIVPVSRETLAQNIYQRGGYVGFVQELSDKIKIASTQKTVKDMTITYALEKKEWDTILLASAKDIEEKVRDEIDNMRFERNWDCYIS